MKQRQPRMKVVVDLPMCMRGPTFSSILLFLQFLFIFKLGQLNASGTEKPNYNLYYFIGSMLIIASLVQAVQKTMEFCQERAARTVLVKDAQTQTEDNLPVLAG